MSEYLVPLRKRTKFNFVTINYAKRPFGAKNFGLV